MASQSTEHSKTVSLIERKVSESLTSAIFIPFHGFDTDNSAESSRTSDEPLMSASLDPVSKLEKILKYLPMQQDAVRAQMIATIIGEIEELKSKARKELETVRASESSILPKEEKDRERVEKAEMEEMFRRIKASARQGKSYELQLDKKFLHDFWRLPQRPKTDADGDIEMEGLEIKPRSLRQIREQLALDMQALVRCGVEKLEQYDDHCRSVLQPYKSSMARKTAGSSSNDTTTGMNLTHVERLNYVSKTSPLSSQGRNMGVAGSRVGTGNDVVRLSNGMPVSMERHPVRKIESLEALTRRSK